jgi:hypothetical protein
MPGAEVSRDPRAVAKGSSGSPRAVFTDISGSPSWHNHSVGGPLSCERSECQGGLEAQLHAAFSIENDKFSVDELAHKMSDLEKLFWMKWIAGLT